MSLGDGFRKFLSRLPQSPTDRLLLTIASIGLAAFLIILIGLVASTLYVGNKVDVQRFEQGGTVPVLPFLALSVFLCIALAIGPLVQRHRGLLPPEVQRSKGLPPQLYLGMPLLSLIIAHETFSLLIPAFCMFFFGSDVSLRALVTETGIETGPCYFAVLAEERPAEKQLEICVGLKLLMQVSPGDAIDISARIWRGYTIRGSIAKAAAAILPLEQPDEIRHRILSSHFIRTRRMTQ